MSASTNSETGGSSGTDKGFFEKVAVLSERIIKMRFPLMAAIFFSVWAPSAWYFLPSVLGNVLLVNSYLKLCVFAISNTLAIIFSVSVYRILDYRVRAQYSSSKGGPSNVKFWPWLSFKTIIVFACTSLASPFLVYFHSFGEGQIKENWFFASLCYFVGLLIPAVIFIALAWIRSSIFGKTKSEHEFFPFENWFDNPGDREARITPEWQIAFYALLICLFYFFALRPGGSEWLSSVFSVPTYLVWLVWLSMLLVSGLGYWLDMARIPTFLVLIGWVILVRGCSVPENFETVSPSQDISWVVENWQAYQNANETLILDRNNINETDNELDQSRKFVEDMAWESVSNRIWQAPAGPVVENKETGKTLVVVTCPGGGIHAASWTSHVLEQLDARYEGFGESIGLISGVSGGSVGTMFYSANRYFREDNQPHNPVSGEAAWRIAAESSLESIAAGIAFDDIPAAFIPKLFDWQTRSDRGKRLENAWHEHLPEAARKHTFGDWGLRALNGEMPIIVLNATDAKSGRRILFDSLPTPPRESHDGKLARPFNYRELILDPSNNDIRVVSAARCSATFPYVSPFVQPDKASDSGNEIAIGDGGYIDNEGILTAIDWIDFISRRYSEERNKRRDAGADNPNDPRLFRRILLIRIQPYRDIEEPPEASGFFEQWAAKFRWLSGPLEALASMRTTSQLERGQLETDLATTYIDTPWWIDGEASGDFNALNYQKVINRNRLHANITGHRKFSKSGGIGPDSQTDDVNEDLPESQAFVGETIKSPIDAPVLMLTFPFIPSDKSAVIPLNWKLSEDQKKVYPESWRNLLKAERAYFRELDQLFKRRETTSQKQ